MDCNTPGFPVLHHLPEFAQTHVPWVQWCHLVISSYVTPSPPALNLSQHQGLFQWVSSSHQVAKVLKLSASVLPMNIQGWFPIGLTGLISLLSERLSRVFSSPTVWKYQFFGAQPSLWSNSHICTWLLEKPQLWLYGPLSAKWYLCFLILCTVQIENKYLLNELISDLLHILDWSEHSILLAWKNTCWQYL